VRETPRRLVRRRELSRAQLREEAQRLGLTGPSEKDRKELAATVGASGRPNADARLFIGELLHRFARRLAAAPPPFLTNGGLTLAFLRRPKPLRVMVVSVAAVAAGALGLMAAYAISPEEASPQVLITNGSTLQIATVTGPGGTTTVAITKTKDGKPRLIPVRILDAVPGPGGTETVSVAVLGPPVTVTDQQVLTQIQTLTNQVTNTQLVTETQIVNQTQTQVVTQIQPVTVVVTDVTTVNLVDTQVVTDTVVVTQTVVVTETVVPPPP
jgi:hypothetical protein